MLRIGAPRLELLPLRFKPCSLPNKKADPDGAGFLFGSGGRIAYAPAGLSYVGRLRRPRSVLFLQFLKESAYGSNTTQRPQGASCEVSHALCALFPIDISKTISEYGTKGRLLPRVPVFILTRP